MSDNEKPVDLGPIELRLRAAMQEKESYSPGIGSDILNDWPTIMDEDYDFVTAPLAQELFDHAPTDIAALLQRVRELEVEKVAEREKIVGLIKLQQNLYEIAAEENPEYYYSGYVCRNLIEIINANGE